MAKRKHVSHAVGAKWPATTATQCVFAVADGVTEHPCVITYRQTKKHRQTNIFILAN